MAAGSVGEQVTAVAALEVVGAWVLSWQPDGGGLVDEPQVRLRLTQERVRAERDHLLAGIAQAEEGAAAETHAGDQPPLAAEPEQPPVACANQPVTVDAVEEGDGRGGGKPEADYAGAVVGAPGCAFAGERLVNRPRPRSA